MDIIGITIISVLFVFAFAYILINTKNDKMEEKELYNERLSKDLQKKREVVLKEKKAKEEKLKEVAINQLGQKMLDAREILKRNKFVIDEEETSPIEIIGKNQYVKMACFDEQHKKMAIVSIVQSAKEPLINYYDIDSIVSCELEVNDKEVYVKKEETNYELKSIKLKIRRNDIINPEYTIGLLPKLVNNPDKVFRQDYFDFAYEIQKKILKNKVK